MAKMLVRKEIYYYEIMTNVLDKIAKDKLSLYKNRFCFRGLRPLEPPPGLCPCTPLGALSSITLLTSSCTYKWQKCLLGKKYIITKYGQTCFINSKRQACLYKNRFCFKGLRPLKPPPGLCPCTPLGFYLQ